MINYEQIVAGQNARETLSSKLRVVNRSPSVSL